jgi:hypothetical protein
MVLKERLRVLDAGRFGTPGDASGVVRKNRVGTNRSRNKNVIFTNLNFSKYVSFVILNFNSPETGNIVILPKIRYGQRFSRKKKFITILGHKIKK